MLSRIQVFFICIFISLHSISAEKELRLLHVLSGNKFYVPDYNETAKVFQAPNNFTYSYFLQNSLEIPNSVKMHLFNLGVHLRESYDRFLGSIYTDEVIQMQTIAFPVSIMAGELINAGLWPPVEPQIWKDDLAWQPIPFVYTPAEEDALLLGTLCPNFLYETKKVLENYNFNWTHYPKIFKQIKQEGKIDVSNPIEISLLYLAVENSLELNQMHPKWLQQIFPSEDLLNLTMTAYDLLSKTNVQKRLNGGSLLKVIVNNSKNHIKGLLKKERKINIYSGDDRILAGVLKNLNIPFYDLPSAGAALIFELYAEANNYFTKIVYYTGASNETIPFTLEGCELYCPMEKFIDLVADVLPENELSLCGSMVSEKENSPGSSSLNVISNSLISILSLSVFYTSTKIL